MGWTQGFGRRAADGCTHEGAQTVLAGGVERTVCPACGHVTFDIRGLDDRDLDRRRFARPADATA